MSDGTVVLYSGGLDSTALLLWAMARGRTHALSFDYGQRHRSELAAASRITMKLGVSHEILTVKAFMEIGVSALVAPRDGRCDELTAASVITPGRNLVFLTLASAVAARDGHGNIAIGATASDVADFSDCRPEFFDSAQGSIRWSTGLPLRVLTPFQTMAKAEVVREGRRLGMTPEIEAETVTCYCGARGVGCGKCHACKVRAEAIAACS